MNIFVVNKPEDAFKLIKTNSFGQTNPFDKWNNLGDQDAFSDNDNEPQDTIAGLDNCIQELVQALNQKELKYRNISLSQSNKGLQDQLLFKSVYCFCQCVGPKLYKTAQGLLEDFASFYKRTKDNKKNPGRNWDKKKVDDELIWVYMRFIENVTRSHCRKYCGKDGDEKERLLSVVLTLLDTEDFRNRIFTQKNIKVGERNPVISYVATLLHLSNSDMFESMDKKDKSKFFRLLRLFLEDKDLYKKMLNQNNVEENEAIQMYITALSNLAYLITPAIKTIKRTTVAQIDYNDIRFLLGAAKKFVEDKTLRNLIFFSDNLADAECNKTIDMFFGLLLHISEHVAYLKNENVDQLLYILNTLFGKQFESLFTDSDFYTPLLLACGKLSALNDQLKVDQIKQLFSVVNEKLFSDKVLIKILPDETLSANFFRVLIFLFNRCRELLDSKAIINVMYDFSNTDRIQKMTIKKYDLYSALLILNNAIKECNYIDDKDVDKTSNKIVKTLNNMLSTDFKFKEQIFSTNKIVGKSENEEKIKYDNELICLYTEILKNTSHLFDNKNIDIELKIKFFDLVKNTLLKKVHEDIQTMFFGENKSVPKDLICNLVQVFFHLCSQENLKILGQTKCDREKVELIELFLSFVYEDEWRIKIFQPENDGKDGAIDFYFRTLDNILVSNSGQLTLEHIELILNLIKALNTKPYSNRLDKGKNFYRRIGIIENQLSEIKSKLKSTSPTQKKLFKNITDIFKPKKSLPASKSTNNLLLEMPGSKNSKSKHKPLLLDKNVKTLKSSISMGNLLAHREKSTNSKLFVNLNTVKPKTRQINTNINSINIKSAFSNNNGNGQPKLEKTDKANFKKNFKDHDTK